MSVRNIFPIDHWKFQSESVFHDLPEKEFAVLTRHQSEKLYKKGEIIFREGAYPTGIFYLKSGKAKKYKLDVEGHEHIIYVANVGELIGYHAVLSEGRYPDSAALLEDSRVVFIPREDFLEALERSTLLGKRLLKALSHEFSVLANTVFLFGSKSVRQRLALQLILLREKYQSSGRPGMPIEINMSRDDLASLVGTVRENVVRVLSEFKAEGIISTRGRKITVLNVNELIRISDYIPRQL